VRAIAWLATASLAFGLAGGSRLNLLPAGVALALLTGVWHWRLSRGAPRSRRLALAAAALAPVGAVGLGLLVINHLRFGHWTEFGRSYVMTYPQLFLGGRFFLPDAYTYGFAPPDWSCAFPFLSAPWDAVRASTPAWLPIGWPADLYAAEPTLGLLVVAPFAWLAAVGAAVAVGGWRLRGASASASTSTSTSTSASAWITKGRWLPVALGVWLVGAAPLLFMDMVSMRYEHDFASALLLLAILGGWRMLAARVMGRRAAVWLYVLLAVATIAAGVLLGFRGYFRQFERHNPALFHTLERHLSLCGRS
jgi:hypothetical protein